MPYYDVKQAGHPEAYDSHPDTDDGLIAAVQQALTMSIGSAHGAVWEVNRVDLPHSANVTRFANGERVADAA